MPKFYRLYRFAEGKSVISKQIWLTMGADKQQWWAQLENSRVCGACEQQNLSVDEFEAKQNMHSKCNFKSSLVNIKSIHVGIHISWNPMAIPLQ